MKPEDSPFPRGWWGSSLEDAGLGDARPDVGTYGRYPHEPLPPLPFEMAGRLDWLAKARRREDHIGQERSPENEVAIRALSRSAESRGLALPEVFLRFMKSRDLQERIRSNTDCFLYLCPALVESPIGGGYLVRFLADSQGCVFWYLYLTRDGSDHAVVASPGFYGSADEPWDGEEPDPSELVYCAESFEAFLCRFWLENEIWFAGYDGAPMPDVGAEYIRRYGRK